MIRLSRYKLFRELPDEYKTQKFQNLYIRIFDFVLKIPKDRLVNKHFRDRNNYGYIFEYILKFLKSRDFYNWKSRIYELMTRKVSSVTLEHFRLVYGREGDRYFDKFRLNRENTNFVKYGTKHPNQSKIVQDKAKATNNERYGTDWYFQTDEFKEKSKKTSNERYDVDYYSQTDEWKERYVKTSNERYGVDNYTQTDEWKEWFRNYCRENFGVDYYSQTDEWKEKTIGSNNERYGVDWYTQTDEYKEWFRNYCRENYSVDNVFQLEEVKEKRKSTNIERYNRPNVGGWLDISGHSKVADEFCIRLYNRISDEMKPCCFFYKKDNKEYELRDKGRIFRYDFTFVRESDKVIVEFDGLYWHGLLPGQKDVKGKPVEEVWEYDREKQRVAESMGFRVIRVREDEYIADEDRCIERVYDDVREFDGV